MQIAITGDVHLNEKNVERLKNLERIFEDLRKQNIKNLIIAGDLFDKGYNGNNTFDTLSKKFPDITIRLLPGNHDPDLKKEQFAAKNITVYSKPVFETIGNFEFLFLPYSQGKSMEEVLIESQPGANLTAKKWILVSHGNYGPYNRKDSGGEKGYFPISDKFIRKYRPFRVILGHVHKPSDIGRVHYPGSPFPKDKNETGQRRYLVLDSEDGSVEPHYLDFTPFYLQWDVFVIPTDNESGELEKQIDKLYRTEKDTYQGENFLNNMRLYIRVNGYTTSRDGFTDKLKAILKNHSIEAAEIDIDNLKQSDKEDLNEIAKEAYEKIMNREFEYPEAKKIAVMEAFKLIYSD